MIFGTPFKLICVLNRNLLAVRFSKLEVQRELGLAGTGPAIGCLNAGIGVNPEPNTGLTCETFALLNRLKNSATTSRRFAPLNGKYFRMRKSIVASPGVFREFLPRTSGRQGQQRSVTAGLHRRGGVRGRHPHSCLHASNVTPQGILDDEKWWTR